MEKMSEIKNYLGWRAKEKSQVYEDRLGDIKRTQEWLSEVNSNDASYLGKLIQDSEDLIGDFRDTQKKPLIIAIWGQMTLGRSISGRFKSLQDEEDFFRQVYGKSKSPMDGRDALRKYVGETVMQMEEYFDAYLRWVNRDVVSTRTKARVREYARDELKLNEFRTVLLDFAESDEVSAVGIRDARAAYRLNHAREIHKIIFG